MPAIDHHHSVGTVRLDSGPVTASGSDVVDRALAPSTLESPATAAIDKGPQGTDASSDSVREILGLLDGASEDAAPRQQNPPHRQPMRRDSRKRSGDARDNIGNADHADATTEELQGERFMQWLRDGIRSHRLIINDAKALVHTVAGTAFLVSPGLFQRYVREHPESQPPSGIQRSRRLAVGAEDNSSGCISTRSSGTVGTYGPVKWLAHDGGDTCTVTCSPSRTRSSMAHCPTIRF